MSEVKRAHMFGNCHLEASKDGNALTLTTINGNGEERKLYVNYNSLVQLVAEYELDSMYADPMKVFLSRRK